MNSLIKKSIHFFLYLFVFTSVNANTLVDFQDLEFSQIRNQGKKILISFSADWCAPCQVMNESIFNDQEIANLINENFIPIKADVDSEIGNGWNELYNANKLPTTLFSQENGKEIERLDGVPNRTDFLNLLHKILAAETITPKASFIKKNEIVSDLNNSTTIQNSYSIQVGAFGSTENALALIYRLNQIGISNVSLLKEYTNGKFYQKVIVGEFESELDARSQLNLLKKKDVNGFVKKNY